MPAEGISLGALFLELGLDSTQFFQDLEFVRSQALNTAKDVKFKIDFDASAAHQTLKGLNDHLDLKEDHIRRINRTPIKPLVDFSNLDILDNRLKAVSNNTVKVTVDSTGLDALEARISDLNSTSINVSANVDFSQVTAAKAELSALNQYGMNSTITVRYEEQQSNNAAIKDLGEVIKDLAKSLEHSGKSSGGSGVGGGLITGIGQQFGFTIGQQVINGLKRNLGFDVKKMTASAMDTVTAPVKIFITENPKLKSEIDKVGQIIENRFRKVFYQFGDGLVAALESNGSFKTRLNAFTAEAFKTDIIEKEFDQLFKDLEAKVPDLTGALIREDVLKEKFGRIGEMVSSYRQTALQERALPLVQERAAEILASKRAKDTANVVDENTQELIIATGGYAGARGLSGARISKDLNRELPEGSKAIWIKNPDTDLPKDAMGSASSKLLALLTSLGKPNLRGYSKDAVEMAAQGYAAVQRNPEITVKLLGESGGGFVAEEAYHILKQMGVENVQYMGVGTPNFTGRLEEQGKIISPDEYLGAETHRLYGKIGLANTEDQSSNILGVAGHPYEHYKNAGVAELQNFLFGAPEPISKDEIDQIKNAAQQFQAQDTSKMDSKEVAKLSEQAFKNLQLIRRHLLVATDETKEDLQEIANLFESVYVKTAPEDKRIGEAKTSLTQAKGIYENLNKNRGLESGRVASQLATELQQIKTDFEKQFKNTVGTTKLKVDNLVKEFNILINNLKDPKLGIKTETDTLKNSRELVQKVDIVNDEIQNLLTNFDEIPQFDQIQQTLVSVIQEVDEQIRQLDKIAENRVGETAQKYQALADLLKGQSEFLNEGSAALEVKKLDEVVSGRDDYFKQTTLSTETYEAYQKAQLANLDQTERYKAFIPDPWYQKGSSKKEDERMKQAQAEFKKGRRDAQIDSVKETIQTGLSWIDRMRGKRKGDAQKPAVDESGAIIIPEKQITLANKVGDAMVNSTISILKIAEPLAVRRINAMLMRSPGGGYEANPMRIDKLSDLTPEMIQHLSALGGWDSKVGLMLGARVLGAGAGMLARTNTGQAVGRFIGDKARWTLARVDDTMAMLNAADKAVEEVASTIPFGTSAWKLVKNVAAPIALGVGTTTSARHAPFLGPAIEAGTNLLQSGIAHGAGFLADATGSQIMSHAPEAVQAASGKMGQLAHLTGADQAFGTLTNWVGEQTSGILADIATGRLLYKKAPKAIAHLTGKGTTLALQAAANKSDVAKGLLQGFEGSEIDQAQDQTFKALQAAGVLTDRQARKAKRVIQNQNRKNQINQEPFNPQVVDLKQPEMVEVLPPTQNQALPPKSEMVHSQKTDLATTSQAIKDAAKTAGEFAGKAYSAGMQAVESFKGVVRDLNSVYQYVEKAFNGFKEANDELIKLVDEYKKGGADFRRIETQLQVIRDVREKAKEQFVKLRQELVETGQIKETVINKEGNQVGIGAVIAGRLGNIGTQVKQAENLVAQTRKMKPEEVAGHSIEVQAKPVGENINQGIAKGFKENNAAVNAVKEGVEEVIDVAKNTLGIQSPSKVFEYIGRMAVEGLAKGTKILSELGISNTIQKEIDLSQRIVKDNLKKQAKPSGSYGINNDYTLPGVYSMDLTGGNKQQKPIDSKKVEELSESGSKIFSTFSAAKGAIGGFINGLKGLENALNKPIFGIENLGTNIKLAIGGFLAFQVAMQAQQWLSQFTQEAFKAAMNLDRLKTAMTFASGSASKASQDLGFVRSTVDDLGIPLEAAQKGFVQMAAAAKSSGISNQDVRATFTGVSQAATVLGLTADDTSGVFLALEQVMSKGKVQAEELRGQIGERLPGAFAIAARSMGVSEQELNKMMETGQVLSSDFIPKFAKQLQVEFGGSAEEASKNAQSAMFRFQNSVLKAQEAFGQVISPSVTAGFDHARVILDLITNNFQTLVNILIGVGVSALIKFGNQFNIVGVAGELLSKTFKDFRKGFGEGLAFIEAVINKDEKAIGTLKVSLQAAWTTIKNIAKTLATEFILPTMLIKTAEGLMDIFGRDELTTKMHDFTEQAVKGLERIRQKASEARGEVSKIGEKGSNKSGGIDLTLGLGDMMGFSFKTDDIIKSMRDVGGKLPAPVSGAINAVNPTMGLLHFGEGVDKDAEGRYTGFVTSAEKKFNDSLQEAIDQRESAFSLYDQVGAGKLKTNKQDLLRQAKEKGASPEEIKRIEGFADNIDIAGSVSQIGKLDEQIRVLKGKKEAAQGQPIVDKKQIKEIDDEMKKVMETRSKLSEPLLAARQSAENQLKSIDSQIEEAKQKFGANSPEVDALNQKFGVTKNVLETVIRQLDGFEKPLKQALDPVRALAIAFEKMNIALEETQRNAEKAFNKAVLSNSQKQLAGFSTNRFNSSEAAVGQAQADLGKAKDMLSGNESAINEMTKELDKPQNQQALAGVTTTSGKQISKDSTIKEIEEAKKRLKDGDPRKDLLDKLKDYKVAVDKLDELRNQVVQGELKVKEAIQQNALNQITEKAADREAINQRIEALNQLKNAQREASIVMQKADADQPKGQIAIKKASLGLSTEEAGVKEADIGIKQSQIGIQESKNQITAAKEAESVARRRFNDSKAQMKDLDAAFKKGDISKEVYHQRSRDLTTQNVQAQSALGQATANVTKAQAGLKQAGVAAQEAIANKIATTITLQRAQIQASVDLQKSQLSLQKAKMGISPEESAVKEAELNIKMAQFQMNLAKKGGSKLEISRATAGMNEAQASKISAEFALEKARLELQGQTERARLNMGKARGNILPEDVSVVEADFGVKEAQRKLDFASRGKNQMETQRAINELTEAQAKKIEAVNARLKAQLESTLRIKEAQLEAYAATAKAEVRKPLTEFGVGTYTEMVVKNREYKIDKDVTDQKIALKRYEISQVRLMIGQRLMSEREGAEKIATIQKDLAQLQSQGYEHQIGLNKELMDSTYKLQDAQQQEKEKQISYIKEINNLNQERLNITKNLQSAQYELTKSQSDVRQGVLQNTINILEKAFSIATEIKEESMSESEKTAWDATKKQTSTDAKKQVLQNIGQYTGVSTSNPGDIFLAKAKMEDQLSGEKGNQLKADQEFQRQQLELDIAGNRMQAEALKLDAESLKIQARTLQLQLERQKLDMKIAEREAVKSGDADSLAIIKNIKGVIGLSENDVTRNLELAANKSALADEKIGSVEAIGDMQRQTLYNKQTAETNQFNAGEFMRKQDQLLAAGNAGINYGQLNQNPNFISIPEPPRTSLQLGFATGINSRGEEIGSNGKPIGVNSTPQIELGGAIQKLAEAINGLSGNLSRPNLTVIGQEPKESAGKIYNDINNIRADAARL